MVEEKQKHERPVVGQYQLDHTKPSEVLADKTILVLDPTVYPHPLASTVATGTTIDAAAAAYTATVTAGGFAREYPRPMLTIEKRSTASATFPQYAQALGPTA